MQYIIMLLIVIGLAVADYLTGIIESTLRTTYPKQLFFDNIKLY